MTPRAGYMPKPRPIMVHLYDELIKHEMFKNINNPYMAKRAGQFIKEIDEWKQNKEKVMKEILELKFKQNENLKTKLISTENSKLFEGNTRGQVINLNEQS